MASSFPGSPRSLSISLPQLRFRRALLGLACFAAAGIAQAQTTGTAGGSAPFGNEQPTVTVTQAIMTTGLFPSSGSGSTTFGATLGFIYPFAGAFAPAGSVDANGQALALSANVALFSLLGTTYGGDGITTFNVPDLGDRAAMGTGTGTGLTARTLGSAVGSAVVMLSTAQMPAHAHSVFGGGFTGATGGSQPFDNVQPSLPLQRLIATNGVFPQPPGNGVGSAAFLGQVATFAGNFVPSGWTPADGRLLSISTNTVLFAVLGTTYGGDGISTFALPDLRGRIVVGAEPAHPVGSVFGEESVTLSTAEMAAHNHAVPDATATGIAGSGQPFDNQQPSLALNYIIATQGNFPNADTSGFDPDTPILGQIAEFAGNYAPSGWALCDGSLLSIATNSALFNVIGTRYGGDGITSFALPDLRGRTLAGASSLRLPGRIAGTAATTLGVGNLPVHAHTVTVTVPTITSATYDASTGSLTVSGTDFLANAGGADIAAALFTLTGEGGSSYTLTDTADVEISSATAFTLTLSATDRAALGPILNKNGASSNGGTTYNLSAGENWDTGADPATVIADTTGNGLTVSNVAVPAITGASYDAATGMLAVTGSGFLSLAGAFNDIVANKFTFTGEGGATYTLTNTANVDIVSGTSFTLTLSVADRSALAQILNKNGSSSTGGTPYNLTASEDWAAGADPAVIVADITGNGIVVSSVAVPGIAFAAYNAATGALTVTGSGFLSLAGAANDIVANRLAITGEGGATYMLTNTANVDIDSGTSFTIFLSATDRAGVDGLLDKNGTSSTGGTTYNLAAAEDWNAGADPATVIADITGNGITVFNVAVPAITSATYNAANGALTVTGSGLLAAPGVANDIVASKLTITGEGGSTYTLTDTANVDITSSTAFTVILSATDRTAVNPILNKNGTGSTGGTTYNLAAAEDWAAGADPAVVVADTTGNGITVSNVAVPAITSATYDAATGALTVTGSGFLSLAGAANDIVASRITIAGQGGATYTLTDTANVETLSGTAFTLSLSATDRTNLRGILDKNGTSSTGGTTYNLAAAEDWAAGADPAVVVADTTGNGITVSNVAPPAIASAAYDAATGALTVSGSGFLAASGAANDIVASKLTLTGEGGATYTLTDTANVEISSITAFTVILSATDRAAVNLILNKNGLGSTGGIAYNLAAADDWDAGADATANIADTTGNAVVVSNVAIPTITSATYDAATGILSVTGTGFLAAAGATNDVVASKLTLTGKGGATYTLTDTADADIASGTAFTLTLSATDKAAAATILDANGTSASDATTYNLAAAEDWAAGADSAVVVADTTGNGITVSGLTPPVVTFTVTPSAGPNGTIAPATAQSVVAGTTTSFTVTPSTGYTASVGGSCGGTLAGSTYTTNAINASCTVIATFTAIPVTTFSGPSATGSGTITASIAGGGAGCGFASAAFIPVTGDPRSPPAGSAPANVSFPQGLFDFTLSGCTAGSTVAFTIVYPQPLPAGAAYWKYGPTPGDASPHWYRLPATVSGDTVTFSITDGAMGDDDLAANGAIVDQGGPGVPGGGGPVPVPTLSEWMLLALAALVALGGLRGLHRKT